MNNIDLNELTTSELLYIANKYCSFRSGYIYKINQIKEYNWLSEENLQKAIGRLDIRISKNAVFEQKI